MNNQAFNTAYLKAIQTLMNSKGNSAYLTAREVADVTGLSVITVYGYARHTASIKVLGRRLYNPIAVVDLQRLRGTHKTLGVSVNTKKVRSIFDKLALLADLAS